MTSLKHLYSFKNADAIRHVFRVTSSLDSMMIGEPQILGQVKEAYRIATNAGAIGMHLSALMSRAFAVAKKVRSETGILASRRFHKLCRSRTGARRYSERWLEKPS